MTPTIYTIGHSNGTVERLLALLHQHEITAVADVRSQPYSRFNAQFNREALAAELKSDDISYAFLGSELGARSDDPACYRGGRAQYSLIAQTAGFQKGIERLERGASSFRVAVLCAEKDPLLCHRSILIARYLHGHGTKVQHILESGELEAHAISVIRLLGELNMQEQNLFLTRDQLIELAYDRQAEKIQYSSEQASQTA